MLPYQPITKLTRREIRKLFKRHHGSQAALARTLGVTPVTVSLWVRGKRKSRRLDWEIPAYARRLIEQEAGNAA